MGARAGQIRNPEYTGEMISMSFFGMTLRVEQCSPHCVCQLDPAWCEAIAKGSPTRSIFAQLQPRLTHWLQLGLGPTLRARSTRLRRLSPTSSTLNRSWTQALTRLKPNGFGQPNQPSFTPLDCQRSVSFLSVLMRAVLAAKRLEYAQPPRYLSACFASDWWMHCE